MALDFLILNPHSDEFYYIPMGTFAICEWLQRKGFAARIVNLAHARKCEVRERIDEAITLHKPRNVGLILHWKETLNAFLFAGSHIRKTYPKLPIWAGGITASAYATDLLKNTGILDGVIRGDSELALEALCRGTSPEQVPNLYYLKGGQVVEPREIWCADGEFLDELCFGNISCVDDRERYLKLIDTRLGFPLAIGRGCAHDCGYCGGSRSAFLMHSRRSYLALRSVGRIIDDLELALEFGAKTFLLSHSTTICDRLLDEIHSRFPRPVPFTLNLELWEVPTETLLQKYSALGSNPDILPRHLVLSIHGSPTESQRAAERRQIVDAAETMCRLDSSVFTTIFSGYFTAWHENRKSLDQELEWIIEVRKRFAGRPVGIAMMALSTDPCSRWSLHDEGMDADLSLSTIAKGLTAEHAVTNNLLLHQPVALSLEFAADFQMLWHLDTLLFEEAPSLWSSLVTAYGFPEYRDILAQVASVCYERQNRRVFPVVSDILSVALAGIVLILSLLETDCAQTITELARLHLASQVAKQARRHPVKRYSGSLPEFLVLSCDSVFESHFNFGKLFDHFGTEHQVSSDLITNCTATERTYYYLLVPEISSPLDKHEINLLCRFNGIVDSETVIRGLRQDLGAPDAPIRNRVDHLWRADVLLGA
jgi:hypothetical protein